MKSLGSVLRWHRESAENVVAASDYAYTLEQWPIGSPLLVPGIVFIDGHSMSHVILNFCKMPDGRVYFNS